MIGASYLSGSLEQLEKWVLASTRTDVYKFFNVKFTQTGFVDSGRLQNFLHQNVAARHLDIERLPKPFAAVATDLLNGREVWLREGNLADAVRASMALPGIFPAVRHNERWLVDGGLVNPVPVSTCRALGADVVIAINLNADVINSRPQRKPESPDNGKKNDGKKGVLQKVKQTTIEYSSAIIPGGGKQDDSPGLFTAITNSINIVQDRITRSRLAGDPAEVTISPRLAHIGMFEFHRAGEAIAEGESCVRHSLEEISKALGRN